MQLGLPAVRYMHRIPSAFHGLVIGSLLLPVPAMPPIE